MREHEEDAAAVRQVQAAVATKEGRALSKASPYTSCTVHASTCMPVDLSALHPSLFEPDSYSSAT